MGISTTLILGNVGSKIVINTDCDETEDNHLTGSAETILSVELDSSNNSVPIFVKFVNATTVGTVGNVDPMLCLKVPANSKATYIFPEGMAFDVGISMWAVTTAGTAGASGPTNPVVCRLFLS